MSDSCRGGGALKIQLTLSPSSGLRWPANLRRIYKVEMSNTKLMYKCTYGVYVCMYYTVRYKD